MLKSYKIGVMVFVIIIIIFVGFICVNIKNGFNKNNVNLDNHLNNVDTGKKIDTSSNNNINLVNLSIGNTKNITGGQLLDINDYKLLIPETLVKKGYTTNIKDNILTIKSKDDSYKCVMLQLSDNYIMPTEEEIEALYETEEYKKWDKEDYNYNNKTEKDLHWEKYDEIYCNYYKKLGYTAQNSPDYVLTDKEMLELFKEYILDGEKESSGSNDLFPGKETYSEYKWGRATLYTIPKHYKYETFGEKTSDFSACIYIIEYYDTVAAEDINVELWIL